MSFAIQCLQEGVIGHGGYVDEIEIYNRLKCDQSIVFEAFSELISDGLLSKEYYEGKGHKVLGKFVKNTNCFEINPQVKNDTYNRSYSLVFTQIQIYKGKKYPFKALEQIYVGSYKFSLKHAREIKNILATDKDFQKVIFKIRKRDKK